MIVIELQFAFVLGRDTTDAILIIRQLQEKFLPMQDLSGTNHSLYFVFIDWEKESYWHSPALGSMVGDEEGGHRWMDSAINTWHVQ